MVKVEGTKLRFSKAAIVGSEPAKTEYVVILFFC